MVGEGDAVGESDGDVEKLEEEEEAYRVSYEDAGEVVWDCNEFPLSAGDGERGVGGSEEVKDEREGMLEEELWEGVRVPYPGDEELDADDCEESS